MSKPPTKSQRERWGKIAELGCQVQGVHRGRTTIHHCFTGAGGRKDHDKVLALCEMHHTGPNGINGGRISRREWEHRYGSEQSLLEQQEERLQCQ